MSWWISRVQVHQLLSNLPSAKEHRCLAHVADPGGLTLLKSLQLRGVGPAQSFGPLEFAPRLNFVTGDNGLGKSFLLDIAWWALTRTWARGVEAAARPDAKEASIGYAYGGSPSNDYANESVFNRADQNWPLEAGRSTLSGIVIYAGVDGGFSVWDPSRNDRSDRNAQGFERHRAFNFTSDEVWSGLERGGFRHCNGLIHDWVLWQEGRQPAFDSLVKVLDALSPSTQEKLIPGRPVRLGMDVTDYPSLHMPYGQDVPLIHASAGMRRIAALAYLLVWTWREHGLACEKTGRERAGEIVFLVDEIECHLHPQWQRLIVPALLKVVMVLTGKTVPVQLIAARWKKDGSKSTCHRCSRN